MANEKSVWTYVGIGCAAVVILGVVVVALGGLWLFRNVKRLEAELKDPAARAAKVKRLLGTEELPAGYHAMVGLSVPFAMDLVVLSGEEPGADGQIRGLGEHGLIYIKMIGIGQDEEELRDYFEGKTSDPRVLRDNHINIDVDEILRRGIIAGSDPALMYVAQRGSVSTQGQTTEGITSIVLVDCEKDRKLRMAIWFGPDPDPAAAADHLDLSGTPADEAALVEFMGQFRFCGGSPAGRASSDT